MNDSDLSPEELVGLSSAAERSQKYNAMLFKAIIAVLIIIIMVIIFSVGKKYSLITRSTNKTTQ